MVHASFLAKVRSRSALFPSIAIAAIAAMIASAPTELPADEHPARALLGEDRVLIIAHRGYSGEAPENTVPAFELAIEAGSDLVELDYFHSQDGEPVVIHDRTLDRTTDAVARWGGSELAVEDYPLARLRELDAGLWFRDGRFRDLSLPTLREAIELIQTGSVTLVERKAGDAETCVKLVHSLGYERELVVQAFDWTFLAKCRRLSPDLALGALGPPRSRGGVPLSEEERYLNETFLDEILEVGAEVAGWNRLVTAEAVAAAHQRGLRVWVYTVNDPALAVELVGMGIDGIITDYPTRIREAITCGQE